jgi:hypothetical protein
LADPALLRRQRRVLGRHRRGDPLMALWTYPQLQAAIADWLERSDLATRIPAFIALAEAQMNRTLRVRPMVARASAAIDGAFSATPADFLEAISLTASDGSRSWALEPAAPEAAFRHGGGEAAGVPCSWTLVGTEFRYLPTPAAALTVELTYYARIPALSDGEPSNWVLADHPDVYLFGALKEAAPFLRDMEMASLFEAKQQAALAALREAQRTPVGRLRTEAPALVGGRTLNINLDS